MFLAIAFVNARADILVLPQSRLNLVLQHPHHYPSISCNTMKFKRNYFGVSRLDIILVLSSLPLFSYQPEWSPSLLPPPRPSCVQTLNWTVMMGRVGSLGWNRSVGIFCGPRMAPWGTARGRPGARSKERSFYSDGGGGELTGSFTHTDTFTSCSCYTPLFLTFPVSLIFFRHKRNHRLRNHENGLIPQFKMREREELEMCCCR